MLGSNSRMFLMIEVLLKLYSDLMRSIYLVIKASRISF